MVSLSSETNSLVWNSIKPALIFWRDRPRPVKNFQKIGAHFVPCVPGNQEITPGRKTRWLFCQRITREGRKIESLGLLLQSGPHLPQRPRDRENASARPVHRSVSSLRFTDNLKQRWQISMFLVNSRYSRETWKASCVPAWVSTFSVTVHFFYSDLW